LEPLGKGNARRRANCVSVATLPTWWSVLFFGRHARRPHWS